MSASAAWPATAAAVRAALETLAEIRASAEMGWRTLQFNSSFQDRLHGVGVIDQAADGPPRAWSGPAARAAGISVDARVDAPRLDYPGFEPVAPAAATGDARARLEQRMLELRQTLDILERILASGPVTPAAARRRRTSRLHWRRPDRKPPRRDPLHRRTSRRRPVGRRPAPHRLLRQLAGRRPRRGRQPPARLPAHQQELRALLRLRRPLMYTLLRDLRRLRRQLDLPRPDRPRSLAIRHVDAGSCNGCEHELTLTSGPHYDLSRYGLGIVASPRHADVLLVTGIVTTRMRDALPIAYNAMPEPRKVAALGNCALGIDVVAAPDSIAGPVSDFLPVDLTIPGCPPTPDQIAEALLTLIDAAQPRG